MKKYQSYVDLKSIHKESWVNSYRNPDRIITNAAVPNSEVEVTKNKVYPNVEKCGEDKTYKYSTLERIKYEALKNQKPKSQNKVKNGLPNKRNKKNDRQNYDTIKQRIYNLEERLIQIKKCYESRQKNNGTSGYK